MPGSVVRRGRDSFRLVVYGGRDPITGEQIQHTRTIRGTKKQAEVALGKFAAEVDEGRVKAGGGTTGEVLERWYQIAKPGWSPTTAKNVRHWLDRYLIPQGRLGHASAKMTLDLYGHFLPAADQAAASLMEKLVPVPH